ncbi:MAG: hypothetical protein KC547_02920 [Anaerolineae bacterium]|nr:hypothetical protein [Anaerolineae bacterium]MCA9907934.1 hypothetical protein [Anaerolineae bacterium]
MAALEIVKVDSAVPYAETIDWWIKTRCALRDENPLTHSHLYDPSYLAWEDVRLKRNPFFAQGTGLEGYLVGKDDSPGRAMEEILAIGKNILDSIARLHRYDYSRKSRLMKTLRGEQQDPHAIEEWSAILGALLGRLRANLYSCPEAEHFQHQTYEIVSKLPRIRYEMDGNREPIRQHYAVGYYPSQPTGFISVEPHLVKAIDQDAWHVAEEIGKFGHPLLRDFVRHRAN